MIDEPAKMNGSDRVRRCGRVARRQLTDALGALAVTLSVDELAAIEQSLPVAVGSRYQEAQMAHLDSERQA